ncbi:MAG: DNA polymerase III subunit delta [Thermogutta sp.]
MTTGLESGLEFLLAAARELPPLCVIYGDDDYLRRLILQKIRQYWLPDADDDFCLREFDGNDVDLAIVEQELTTVSMFSSTPRVVIVENADRFVTQHRGELEKFFSAPTHRNILLLSVSQWPANTRLAKLALEKGLVLDCAFARRKSQELVSWTVAWAKHQHGLILDRAVAEMLLESVGPACGLIDQELTKFAGLGKKKITAEMVASLTGTWRTKAVWDVINSALGGKPAESLREIHKLLEAGETPLGILGMIAPMLRRLNAATRRYVFSGPGQKRVTLQEALAEAGVPRFALKAEEERLRKLGRRRAWKLLNWLRAADAAMKGGLATDPRLVLERLIVVLADPVFFSGDFDPL